MKTAKMTVPLILSLAVSLSAFVASAPSQEVFDLLRKGDVANVKALVEKSPPLVVARDNDGNTLLHHAANGGDAGLVSFLIDKGAKVEAAGQSGLTPLHGAAMNNRTDAVSALLARGAALEARCDYGRTALIHCARERGQIATARVLIEAGADVNAADKFGSNALELAAWRGKKDVVEYLMEKGAALPEPGEKWYGMLFQAASQGLETLFRPLAAKVRDLKAAAGVNLLHAAAEGGSAGIITLLLDKGYDAAAADRFGWTPLHYAARDGRVEAARALVERGAPIDAHTTMGQTAYNIAQERKTEAVSAFLAAKGADRSEIRFPLLEGDYLGQKPPGDKPELFGPGIVSSIWGLHSTAVFSPDGNEVYWAPMMTFPGEVYSRGGLLMMKRVDGRWTPPAWASFSGPSGNDDVPFFSADGKRLHFISRRPLPGESLRGSERIWFVDRTPGGWSEPRPLDPNVNSMNMHWEFSLDKKGNVYFAGNAPGGLGLNDIYVARFVDGKYERPVNAGPPVNSAAGEECPFIAPDGSYLLFSRQYDLWVSFRGTDGAWSEPVNLGLGVNSPSVELCPIVTADGEYLFFLSQRDGESHAYWVRAEVIEKLRPQTQKPRDKIQLAEPREKRANDIQPPELVMYILGVRPDLVVGEVGAGYGRVTVHLATRVGEKGKVYANDIDLKALEYLEARCRRLGLKNVEVIHSLSGDARFPQNSLDLALMTWVYHHVDDPVPLLKSLLPSLKPSGFVALVEPKPSQTEEEGKALTRESVEKEARAAGFTLDAIIEDRLKEDNIFILRPVLRGVPDTRDSRNVRAS
jgi:ankyrin repeat protein/SAM-dependent methyltransferase